jgi:FkbM family methyltransferase
MGLRKYPYYLISMFELAAGVRPLSTVWKVFKGEATPGEQLINLPRHGVQFKVRGPMDIWSVKETFLDRFYERFGIEVGADWTIVDIGGGIGDFTTFAAKAHPSNRVYAFEPTPDSYRLLQENLALNGISNAQSFQEAIWSHTGSLRMDASVGEPGQYISYEDHPGMPGQIQVPSLDLQEAFNRLQLTACDLLKMDCEGAEYAILFNAPVHLFSRIRRIVMEYHDRPTQYTHSDLEKFLSAKGYVVKIVHNYVHNDLGYLYAEQHR